MNFGLVYSLLRAQRQALRYAQQSFFDGVNTEEVDNDESPTTPEDRYQIVNSHVPLRGGYRVENCKDCFFSIKSNSIGSFAYFSNRDLQWRSNSRKICWDNNRLWFTGTLIIE